MNALMLRNMTTSEVVNYAVTYSTDNVTVRLATDIEMLAAELILLQSLITELTDIQEPLRSDDLQPILNKVDSLCAAL